MSSYVDINTSDIFNTQIGGQDYDAPESSNTGLFIVSSVMSCCLLLISLIALAIFYYYYYYIPQQEENKTPVVSPVPTPLILT